jgi:hemerythrin-like metal-binding protein
MAFFNWSDDLSVGVAEIDGQHRYLIEIINDLFKAMQAGKGHEAVGAVLDQLIEYTGFHFKTEERLMKTYRYAHPVFHLQEHEKLVDKILSLQADYKAGKAGVSMSTLKFLKAWLYDHILKVDKRFARFLNSQGLY